MTWALVVLASAGACSLDREPRITGFNRSVYLAEPLPDRTQTDLTGNDQFGDNPVPTGDGVVATEGGLTCSDVPCPFTVPPLTPCCTEQADVERGAARFGGACGVDYSAVGGVMAGACWQRDQPGLVDDGCPERITSGGSTEFGCCTPEGKCGTFDTEQGVGCHFALDQRPASCIDDQIDRGSECEGTGVFAIRAEIDVTWGGRSGGLVGLTDDGRGPIVIDLLARVEEVAADNTFSGSVRSCGVDLPAFYSSTLCETYKPVFPIEMWDSPQMPIFPLNGQYGCLNPGCSMTINAQTVLLGIELGNPEAPWPTPSETPMIRCPTGRASDCFLDHDDDTLPGLTIDLRTSGSPPAGSGKACLNGGGDYRYIGAPLSANIAAIFGGVRRARHILLGTRVKLGGGGELSSDCGAALGAGVAEFVQSRAWGCIVQEGSSNFGGPVAEVGEPCDAAEAAFMDENLPIYRVMTKGSAPDAALDVVDTQASEGPIYRTVRLGAIDQEFDCIDVREAAFP